MRTRASLADRSFGSETSTIRKVLSWITVGSEMNRFHLGLLSSLQKISACERTTCLLDQASIAKVSKINRRIAKMFE